MKKLLSITLVLVMVCMLFAACNTASPQEPTGSSKASEASSKGETQEPGAPQPLEEVTIEYLDLGSNTSGLMDGYHWSKFIKENTGVVVNLIPAGDNGDEKYQTYLASNDMPDMVMTKNDKLFKMGIDANAFINLDDHADKIPNMYSVIKENALDYIRDAFGGLYAYPDGQTNEYREAGILEYGWCLRWDYYKESGMPVYDDTIDYLDLFEEWQTAYPTNDDGQKVYAFSIFSDWDGAVMRFGAYLGGYQYGNNYYGSSLIEFNNDTRETKAVTDDDSDFKKTVELLFEANQRGLLDPDSMTQRFQDYQTKVQNGCVLCLPAWNNFNTKENTDAGKAIYQVGFGNMRTYDYAAPWYLGNDQWRISVSSTSEVTDKVLEYINFIFNEENYWRITFGPQGEYWDIDENGGVYVTERGIEMQSNPELTFEDGGKLSDGFTNKYVNSVVNSRVKSSIYGFRYDGSDWVKKDYYPQDQAVLADWKATYGVDTDLEFARKNDYVADYVFVPLESQSDDIVTLESRLGEGTAAAMWECIYADDRADFDAKWAALQTKLNDLGMEELRSYYNDAINRAIDASSKYIPQ